MRMSEKEIIRRCQNGDRAAFDELIRLFYPYVTKYLLKLTRDENLAEDLTQETFLKIIRTIDRYRINGSAAFSTYIITVAKNSFIDYTRRNRAVLTELGEAEQKSGEDIEEKVINGLDFRRVVEYIDSLPPEQAVALRLKYIEEYTLREIEEMTGVPQKTVKSRLHEGKKKLRAMFGTKKREE